jgi:hypothetical protein
MDPNSWAGKRNDACLPEDQIVEEIKIYNDTVRKVNQGIETINRLQQEIVLPDVMRKATLELLEVAEELEGLEITLPHIGVGPHV